MPKVVVNLERCKQCELCIAFCNQECLAVGEELNAAGYYPVKVIKPEACKGCGLCTEMCPDMALEVYK